MDARKLKRIDTSDPMALFQGATDLTAAQDDGFTLTDREELAGVDGGKAIPLYLVGWEITDGMGGQYAEVWALAMFAPDDVRKVKFRDGGRSFDGITATLSKLTKNGVYGNVRLIMLGETYNFNDRDTGEAMSAVRYTLHDPEMAPVEKATVKVGRKGSPKDEEPDF